MAVVAVDEQEVDIVEGNCRVGSAAGPFGLEAAPTGLQRRPNNWLGSSQPASNPLGFGANDDSLMSNKMHLRGILKLPIQTTFKHQFFHTCEQPPSRHNHSTGIYTYSPSHMLHQSRLLGLVCITRPRLAMQALPGKAWSVGLRCSAQ